MSWAEIKKTLNSTIGTPQFKPLDEMLQTVNRVVIESNTTWVSPVTGTVFLSAISAGGTGGQGGSGSYGYNSTYGGNGYSGAGGGGGQGGCGNYVIEVPISVVKGQSYNVTVGTGNTVFANLITLPKGNNGAQPTSGSKGGEGGLGGGEFQLFTGSGYPTITSFTIRYGSGSQGGNGGNTGWQTVGTAAGGKGGSRNGGGEAGVNASGANTTAATAGANGTMGLGELGEPYYGGSPYKFFRRTNGTASTWYGTGGAGGTGASVTLTSVVAASTPGLAGEQGVVIIEW